MICNYNERVTFDCHDGYLHDMDYDYIDPEDLTYPCPKCNMIEYFITEKENIDGLLVEASYWDDLLEDYCTKFNVTLDYLQSEFQKCHQLQLVIVTDENYNKIVYDYANWRPAIVSFKKEMISEKDFEIGRPTRSYEEKQLLRGVGYELGYEIAERDIKDHGLEYAEKFAKSFTKNLNPDHVGFLDGYEDCIYQNANPDWQDELAKF